MKNITRVPSYHGLRIYAISTLIYLLLVFPFLMILFFKNAPDLLDKNPNSGAFQFHGNSAHRSMPADSSVNEALMDTIINLNPITLSIDTLIKPKGDDSHIVKKANTAKSNDEENNPLSKSLNLLFKLLVLSFLLGFIFNLPFKRYFSRKRKNKMIKRGLYNYCKKTLLKTPLINSGILFIAFGVTSIYMTVLLIKGNGFSDDIQRNMFNQYYYVSIISSLLTLLFVYFWQRHRVHIRYLEHIFTAEELRKRIFKSRSGKIKMRFWISSTMTTFLPLLVVILYLLLSLTSVKELGPLNPDQVKILLGNYPKLGIADTIEPESLYESLYYVNAIDNISMFLGIGAGIFISFIYILFYVRWSTRDITYPVQELLSNMKETGEGKMNNFSIVRTNDEIGQLTEGFNDMSEKLKEYINNISRMNEAYARFVPKQFLDFLDKKTYVDIQLGDQVEKEMTILFSDIRSFTELSEGMSPKENFDFLNHYLGYMEPVIRNNNGFIDKYIGDSIMALFPNDPGDAINAAIEMRIKLAQFNQVMGQFGKPEIDSGIGIHIGTLMLGVVGGEGRMDGTVISDAVNLASRLEGLTKLYGTSIIISEDTLIKLENPGSYNYRFLDVVKVKGKKKAVYIFEVIDGEAEDIKKLKMDSKNHFARAINLYKNKKFKEALEAFNAAREINMHDKAINLYMNRCEKILHSGIPDNWDGVEIMDFKY